MKWLIAFCIILSLQAKGQDLEPRALSTLPLKTTFFGAGYNYSFGNVLLDPVIPIEDLKTKVHSGFLAYVRSFGLFGNSSKISVVLPFADAFFEGVAFGQDSTRSVAGMGDPVVIFSTNFYGSPALSIKDYADYKQGTVVGFNLKMKFPLGQYDEGRTLNIGSNRFMLRPELGVSTRKGKWIFESYLALWLFSKNNEFWSVDRSITMEQQPIFAIKQHFIYALKNKTWFALNAGYGIGGKTTNNGYELDNRVSTIRLGCTFVKPFGKGHAIKLNYNTAIALEKGPAFQAFNIVYQYWWIKK